MAGPYASLTSPYAPGPGHMDSALRIADLIGQQGQSAARAQLAKRLMVGDLVSGIGNTVGNLFARRDQQQQQAAEAQVLADLFSSGKPVDLPTLIQTLGIDRAKALYPMIEAEVTKRTAASKEANELGLRQRHADALKQGADPTAINLERWGEGAPLLPAQMLPDPAVVKAAATEAARKEAIDAITAAAGDPVKERQARRVYAAKTGLDLDNDLFTPVAPKPGEHLVTETGPDGQPRQRLVPDDELRRGVQGYRAPTGGGATEQDWVLRGGSTTPIPIPRGTAQPGDVPYTRGMARRNVTAGDAEALADFDTSLDDVAVLRDTIAPLDPKTGLPLDTGGSGFVEWAKTYTPGFVTETTGIGAEAKSKQAVIARVKQVIGKTLEGGVLRKEDEVKYKDILPLLEDPPAVVRSKLNGLEAAIKKRKQRRLDALTDADYDTSRFESRGTTAAAEAADAATALKGKTPNKVYELRDPATGQVSRWRLMPNGTALKVN